MPPKQATFASVSRAGRGRPAANKSPSFTSRGGAASRAARGGGSFGSGARQKGRGNDGGRSSLGGRKRRQDENEEDEMRDVEGSDDRGDGEDDEVEVEVDEDEEGEEDEEQQRIPPELLTRILHEFFQHDGTRITRDANAAVARYVDVFVREAIARAAVEREGGFLEVEDLEKIAPQLLMDL
ncbi:hypothetical protein VTK56DRAFT_8847 [Thermocarpiscus australiensis]